MKNGFYSGGKKLKKQRQKKKNWIFWSKLSTSFENLCCANILSDSIANKPPIPTWGMGVPFKMFIQNFQCLWCKRCSSFTFLGWLAADEVGEILDAIFVPFLGFSHPALQHRLDFLRTLWRYVEFLKPVHSMTVNVTWTLPYKLYMIGSDVPTQAFRSF